MDPSFFVRLLKRDALGRVELLEHDGVSCVRRVACGSALPFSRWIARRLLLRERRALETLAGLERVPRLFADQASSRPSGADGTIPGAREVLVRTFLTGEPLHRAEELPEDFFALLEQLVRGVHARGVCHNDLHKEQNVIVGLDGRPGLVDFQLASVHARRGALFSSRVKDDLRHVDKHRRRYTRTGRGPRGAPVGPSGPRPARTLTSKVWRAGVKPFYNLLTRALLRRPDGEERRSSHGPWPRWTPPVGPSS